MYQYGTDFFSAPTRGLADKAARLQIGGQIAQRMTLLDKGGWELVGIVPIGQPGDASPVLLAHAGRNGPEEAEPESHFMVVLRRMVLTGDEPPDLGANGEQTQRQKAEEG